MARTGVQYSDIQKAAAELQGSGKIPTVDGVREILGTGSKTTITQHLRTWKADQLDPAESLPRELAAAVTGLWKKVHQDAETRINTVESSHRQETDTLNQALAELQQAQTKLKDELHKNEELAANESKAKKTLENSLQQTQQEQVKYAERAQATTRQLESTRDENTRLHQLAANTQRNLEHYQEKMHKHQTEQALQTEKQQGLYLQEIMQLKQQLTHEQGQARTLEQEQNQLQQALKQSENQHQQALTKNETMQQQLQSTTREKNILCDREATAKQTVDSLTSELGNTKKQLHQQETKTAVLLDQNSYLKKELDNTQDKIETLRQEKLFLAQEKAQLEGYLNKVKHTDIIT